MLMRNFRNGLYVRNIAIGITQHFDKDCRCIFLDCRFRFCQIMNIYKCCLDTIIGKCMGQQIIAAAINCFLCYNMIALLRQRFNGIRNGGSSGSQAWPGAWGPWEGWGRRSS